MTFVRVAVVVVSAALLFGCDFLTPTEDSGTTMPMPDASVMLDSGMNTQSDAGHHHPEDAGTEDGGHDVDGGHIDVDGGHIELDGGHDVDGGGHVDPDGGVIVHPTDAGHDAGIEPPAPMPQVPYEADAGTVVQSTQSVAIIPRPAFITEPAPSNCPHQQSGLTPWDPTWATLDGTVTLPANTRVLLSGNSAWPTATRLRQLIIPAGSELIIDDVPATWRVADLRVRGALRLGSPTCRLASTIAFEFDTNEDLFDLQVRAAIFAREGLGLVVDPGGELAAFGALFQPTWTRLSSTFNSGSSTVQLSEAVNWRIGQQIVVTTTQRNDYPTTNDNEVSPSATSRRTDARSR